MWKSYLWPHKRGPVGNEPHAAALSLESPLSQLFEMCLDVILALLCDQAGESNAILTILGI